jgi:acyl dehydratase
MAIDPEAVGASTGPFESSWSEYECMRYALSVGAASEDPLGPELAYVTENTSGSPLRTLPTMCTVLGGVLHAPSPLAKIGSYDRKMVVHGSVELELHEPLPTVASVKSTITVDGIYDKQSGALVSQRIDAVGSDGTRCFTVRNGIFIRGEGGWGGDRGPAWPAPVSSTAEPDSVVVQQTRADQPLLYRMNGDHNPLHSDPALAIAAGFERPIMHGMCTVGFVGRALLAALCDGDPTAIRSLGCRFAAPALPGEPLETSIWKTAHGGQFEVRSGGRIVLSNGYCTLR